MARKKHEEQEEGGGAWEIALADLMTTLMVFFLVMWLTAIVEPSKRQAFVDALIGDSSGKSIIELKDGAAEKAEAAIKEEKPPASTEDIAEAMKGVNPKDVEIEDTDEFTKITLHSDSFFESGRANISEKTREQLEKLGETLSGRKQNITITGYTDSIPIENFQFPSNWELSAARASTVARTFIYMGVDKTVLTIVGKGDNEAVAPNTSPYGRSLNRRVIILVDKKSHDDVTKLLAPAKAAANPVNPPAR